MTEKEGLPKLVNVSTEAYRMFRSMGPEGNEEETDGNKKVRTKTDAVFSDYVRAFLISFAWGILNNARQKVGEDKHWLIRGEYLANHYGPYRQLLKSKFGIATDKEIVETMVEYAEAGVRALHDEYKKTGRIDFARLSRLSPRTR